jgi:alcohol dehydrogenase
MLLGHEAAGIVESLGDDVTGLRIGDRVVMSFLPRCGECAGCRTGGRLACIPGGAANTRGELLAGGSRLTRAGASVRHHLGVSAFATHAVVDHRSVVRVDDDVPPTVAALLGCAVMTGGGAVLNAADLHDGDTLIVVGLGGVGMAAMLTGLSLGRGPVIGVDALPAKLETALGLGATAAYAVDAPELEELRGAVVVEAAGSARAFELAVALTAPGGRTVTVGLPPPHAMASVSPLQLVAESRTIVGSYLGSAVPARDIPRFVEAWRSGTLPVESLISATIQLEQINQAMDDLASGTALRQMIAF